MPKRVFTPARLVILLTVAIFAVEFLLMMVLRQVSALSEVGKASLDALALILVLSPALYFLFYRPMRREIHARTLVETVLRKKNRELDLFVENVAHSLRSSMNTIIGSAWFLHDKYHERIEGKDGKLLSVIEQDGRKVLAIIDDLVALSRLQNGGAAAQELDVAEIVRDVVHQMEDEQKGGTCAVSIGDLPGACISKSHLTILVDNLLRNALRYGKRDGAAVEVYGQRSDLGFRLYVRDHGVGVPAEERDRIFDVLYRGVRTRHLPGSGVGLALVRKIARLHGGDVWVEETPGGGATFCLELKDEKRRPFGSGA